VKNFNIYTLLFSFCALWGCSADDDGVADIGDGDYIRFGAQVVEPVTRAAVQQPGIIDFEKLTDTSFGVYGYGPMATDYAGGLTPGVFDNQKVQYVVSDKSTSTVLAVPGSWSYAWDGSKEVVANLKPWPKTNASASKYTFFAYAPYMAEGGTAPGITSVSSGGSGDPTIGYSVASATSESVDLLWGVHSETGFPWLNVTRANKTTSAVLFTMRHALCAIGYHAQVMVNEKNQLTDLTDESSFSTIGTGCRVTLKSITLAPKSGGKNFYASGTLNLNNTAKNTPLWTLADEDRTVTQLVLDTEIDAKLKDPDPTEAGNTTFMGKGKEDEGYIPGVTESANTQTVIAGDNVFMVIPDAKQDYTATVEYFVTYTTGTGTYNRKLYTGTANIKDLELKAGTKYYLNLVFGLTTFKLVVTAQDWNEQSVSTTVVVEDGTSASSSLSRRAASAE
jgi:hypothetical protein